MRARLLARWRLRIAACLLLSSGCASLSSLRDQERNLKLRVPGPITAVDLGGATLQGRHLSREQLLERFGDEGAEEARRAQAELNAYTGPGPLDGWGSAILLGGLGLVTGILIERPYGNNGAQGFATLGLTYLGASIGWKMKSDPYEVQMRMQRDAAEAYNRAKR
jgi:hypothetical protein